MFTSPLVNATSTIPKLPISVDWKIYYYEYVIPQHGKGQDDNIMLCYEYLCNYTGCA